jgi:hypothetical protein
MDFTDPIIPPIISSLTCYHKATMQFIMQEFEDKCTRTLFIDMILALYCDLSDAVSK